jgi:hypothetical protein
MRKLFLRRRDLCPASVKLALTLVTYASEHGGSDSVLKTCLQVKPILLLTSDLPCDGSHLTYPTMDFFFRRDLPQRS